MINWMSWRLTAQQACGRLVRPVGQWLRDEQASALAQYVAVSAAGGVATLALGQLWAARLARTFGQLAAALP